MVVGIGVDFWPLAGGSREGVVVLNGFDNSGRGTVPVARYFGDVGVGECEGFVGWVVGGVEGELVSKVI